jgi:hypothetical protein
MGAQRQAKRRRALACAVTGVDDEQATTLGFFALLGGFGGWGLDVHVVQLCDE